MIIILLLILFLFLFYIAYLVKVEITKAARLSQWQHRTILSSSLVWSNITNTNYRHCGFTAIQPFHWQSLIIFTITDFTFFSRPASQQLDAQNQLLVSKRRQNFIEPCTHSYGMLEWIGSTVWRKALGCGLQAKMEHFTTLLIQATEEKWNKWLVIPLTIYIIFTPSSPTGLFMPFIFIHIPCYSSLLISSLLFPLCTTHFYYFPLFPLVFFFTFLLRSIIQ